jgi:hypothetical protein
MSVDLDKQFGGGLAREPLPFSLALGYRLMPVAVFLNAVVMLAAVVGASQYRRP